MLFLGPSFWKSSSRKLFSIPKRNYKDYYSVGQKRPLECVEDQDATEEEEEMPRSGLNSKISLSYLEVKMDSVLNHVKAVKAAFDDAILLTKDNRIPPGLRKALRDSFKCRICLNTMAPPVVIMKCCRIIIGCEACVNGWFTGDDALLKPCPSCRTERGYTETMVLRGMDDFLKDLRKCNLAPASGEPPVLEQPEN